MSTKHTKGPWMVVRPDAKNPSRAVVSAFNGEVSIYNAPLTRETESNARLIAQAPALFAELKRLTDICDRLATLDDGSSPETINAHYIITQIEGEES